MATVTIQPNPFVNWKFKCNSAAEAKEAKKNAKKFLTYYLKGVANVLTIQNPLNPKFSYQITNNTFSPVAGSRHSFIYSATVKRKTAAGADFPQPDSTVNPPNLRKPNP